MLTVVAFDFLAKQEDTISRESVAQAFADGRFCWIDLDLTRERASAAALLAELGLHPTVIEAALEPGGEDRHDVYDECLHLGITEVRFRDGQLATAHVDLVLSERF